MGTQLVNIMNNWGSEFLSMEIISNEAVGFALGYLHSLLAFHYYWINVQIK